MRVCQMSVANYIQLEWLPVSLMVSLCLKERILDF